MSLRVQDWLCVLIEAGALIRAVGVGKNSVGIQSTGRERERGLIELL